MSATDMSTAALDALMERLGNRASGVEACADFSAAAAKFGMSFVAVAMPHFIKVLALVSDKKSNPLRKAAKQSASELLDKLKKN